MAETTEDMLIMFPLTSFSIHWRMIVKRSEIKGQGSQFAYLSNHVFGEKKHTFHVQCETPVPVFSRGIVNTPMVNPAATEQEEEEEEEEEEKEVELEEEERRRVC